MSLFSRGKILKYPEEACGRVTERCQKARVLGGARGGARSGEVMSAQATPGSGGLFEDLGFFLRQETGGYLTGARRGVTQALAKPLSAVWCAESSLRGGRGYQRPGSVGHRGGGGLDPTGHSRQMEVSGLWIYLRSAAHTGLTGALDEVESHGSCRGFGLNGGKSEATSFTLRAKPPSEQVHQGNQVWVCYIWEACWPPSGNCWGPTESPPDCRYKWMSSAYGPPKGWGWLSRLQEARRSPLRWLLKSAPSGQGHGCQRGVPQAAMARSGLSLGLQSDLYWRCQCARLGRTWLSCRIGRPWSPPVGQPLWMPVSKCCVPETLLGPRALLDT